MVSPPPSDTHNVPAEELVRDVQGDRKLRNAKNSRPPSRNRRPPSAGRRSSGDLGTTRRSASIPARQRPGQNSAIKCRRLERRILEAMDKLENRDTMEQGVGIILEVIGQCDANSLAEFVWFMKTLFSDRATPVHSWARREQILLVPMVVKKFAEAGTVTPGVLRDRLFPVLVLSLGRTSDAASGCGTSRAGAGGHPAAGAKESQARAQAYLVDVVGRVFDELLDLFLGPEEEMGQETEQNPIAPQGDYLDIATATLDALLRPLESGSGSDMGVKRRCALVLGRVLPSLLRRGPQFGQDVDVDMCMEELCNRLAQGVLSMPGSQEAMLQCLIHIAASRPQCISAGNANSAEWLVDLCTKHLLMTPSAAPSYCSAARLDPATTDGGRPSSPKRHGELTRELALVCCLCLGHLAEDVAPLLSDGDAFLDRNRQVVLEALSRDNINLHRLVRSNETLRQTISFAWRGWCLSDPNEFKREDSPGRSTSRDRTSALRDVRRPQNRCVSPLSRKNRVAAGSGFEHARATKYGTSRRTSSASKLEQISQPANSSEAELPIAAFAAKDEDALKPAALETEVENQPAVVPPPPPPISASPSAVSLCRTSGSCQGFGGCCPDDDDVEGLVASSRPSTVLSAPMNSSMVMSRASARLARKSSKVYPPAVVDGTTQTQLEAVPSPSDQSPPPSPVGAGPLPASLKQTFGGRDLPDCGEGPGRDTCGRLPGNTPASAGIMPRPLAGVPVKACEVANNAVVADGTRAGSGKLPPSNAQAVSDPSVSVSESSLPTATRETAGSPPPRHRRVPPLACPASASTITPPITGGMDLDGHRDYCNASLPPGLETALGLAVAGRVDESFRTVFQLGNEASLLGVLENLESAVAWPCLPDAEAKYLARLLVKIVCKDPTSAGAVNEGVGVAGGLTPLALASCQWLEELARLPTGTLKLEASDMPGLRASLFNLSAARGASGRCAASTYQLLFENRQNQAVCGLEGAANSAWDIRGGVARAPAQMHNSFGLVPCAGPGRR